MGATLLAVAWPVLLTSRVKVKLWVRPTVLTGRLKLAASTAGFCTITGLLLTAVVLTEALVKLSLPTALAVNPA